MGKLVRTREELIKRRRRGLAVDYLPQDGPRAAARRCRQMQRQLDRFLVVAQWRRGGPLNELRAHVDALEAGK